jgi:hypothetical protein
VKRELTDQEIFLRELFGLHELDELREAATAIGHTLRRRKLDGSPDMHRWECSCGFYNVKPGRATAYDEAKKHLKLALLDEKLARKRRP